MTDSGSISRPPDHAGQLEPPWVDVERRHRLAVDLMAALEAEGRVERTELFGSLAADPDIPDRLSDIDIDVWLADAFTDVDFLAVLPPLLEAIAPIRAMRTMLVGPDMYVLAAWFEGYPPYWHADIRCRTSRHVYDVDLVEGDRWSEPFTLWMVAVKRLTRSFEFLAWYRRSCGQQARQGLPAEVVVELRQLLSNEADATAHISASKCFHSLCLEVDEALLGA